VQSKATTPQEYIDELEEPRKSDIAKLDKLIRATVPNLKPVMISGMLGYGLYHYKYDSGREGDWPVIGLASQKNYISLYVSCVTPQGYLAEEYKENLPKANIGKSCIRFKKLEEVDLNVIKDILRKAEMHGGMGAVL
jgi:uncharacterized protein YdhG (YjbR/CyaY superfamily)